MKKLFFLLTVLTLSGCATNTTVISNLTTPASISNVDLNESTGILVGSYTKNVGESEYDVRSLLFTDTKTYKSEYAITRKPLPPLFPGVSRYKYTLKDNDKEGDVFALVLPAGTYTLYNFALTSGGRESWKSASPFSIPFVVHPNKVNYIGEMNFTSITRETNFKFPLSRKEEKRAGYWTISDELDRDKLYLSEKYKNLPLIDIQNVIPEKKKGEIPFVILPNEREAFEANLAQVKSGDGGDNEIFGEPINTLWLTCKKPYKFEQDCSVWSGGAKKKIIIDGHHLKVAGTSDGKTVLVMETKPSNNRGGTYNFEDLVGQKRVINGSYHSIKSLFEENDVVINEVRILKETLGITGYVLLLENDGYSYLKKLPGRTNK